MESKLTRRRFLAAGGAVLGVLAFPLRALAATKTHDLYKLTPCPPGKTSGKPCSCHACVVHDANSLFPSSKAADGNRAHINCNCSIVKGTLDFGTYVALFGNPGHLRSYRADLRSRNVQAILKNHPPQF
jgi:hypothetical protein